MAVVIRLQGLPAVAGSVDIRQFFNGLQIPGGAVHIIGGKLGEAFVIFATDEDARRAMSRTGGVIKKSNIQLFLSSKTEMQNTLESSRKPNKNPKHPAVPPSGNMNQSAVMKTETHVQKYDKKKESSTGSLYLYLAGLPYAALEEDIIQFFKDLDVAEILFCWRPNGLKNGNAFVKFRSLKDAEAAMSFQNKYIGNRFISLSKTTEVQWVKAGGVVDKPYPKQPIKRTRSRSPQNQQFYVHLQNLSCSVEKEDIKYFFGASDMEDTQIKFLFDKLGNRARECFVMLKSQRQYEICLGLHNCNMKGQTVFIHPIPRKAMLELIESYETQCPSKQDHAYEDFPRREQSSLKRCIYLKNFPFNVTKAEVQKFFSGFLVHADDICLLFDNRGVGLGEALVRFPSEEQAMHAEGLNRQQFLGTEVLLMRIPDEQMKEFGAFIDTPVKLPMAHSAGYRDENMENRVPVAHDRSHGFTEYDRREFGGSQERPHGSMEFKGRGESHGGHDMGNNQVEYGNSFSASQQSFDTGPAGALIRMKNLPYTIRIPEIVDFFYGFNILRDSIDIKFDNKGMATGHATVCFHNYDEAFAAVEELNKRPIGPRNVLLNLSRL